MSQKYPLIYYSWYLSTEGLRKLKCSLLFPDQILWCWVLNQEGLSLETAERGCRYHARQMPYHCATFLAQENRYYKTFFPWKIPSIGQLFRMAANIDFQHTKTSLTYWITSEIVCQMMLSVGIWGYPQSTIILSVYFTGGNQRQAA